jgi:hypothetical protein
MRYVGQVGASRGLANRLLALSRFTLRWNHLALREPRPTKEVALLAPGF